MAKKHKSMRLRWDERNETYEEFKTRVDKHKAEFIEKGIYLTQTKDYNIQPQKLATPYGLVVTLLTTEVEDDN